MPPLRTPDDIRAELGRKFKRQRTAWLRGEGEWPLRLTLGAPSSAEAERILDLIPAWIASWRQWNGPGEVQWMERRWRIVGTQRLPQFLLLSSPFDVAQALHEGEAWRRASQRFAHFVGRWPAFQTRIGDYYDVLAEYSDADIARLIALLTWLEKNPQSRLHPRQLPVEALDTKWFESHQTLVADLFATLRGIPRGVCSPVEFCGLLADQPLVRTRVLDMELRNHLGGLGDFAAPASGLARLSLPVQRVLIIENLQPGLVLSDLKGTLVFMGLGYALDQLMAIHWLQNVPIHYWGDIDTHGFAMLSMARQQWPQVQSMLMDERTLLEHEQFWGSEEKQHPATLLPGLTCDEQQLYTALKNNHWRKHLRLEQERIRWADAWQRISATIR